MSCRGCAAMRGLGQINAANGATFIRCLLSELGVESSGKWTAAAHEALYERAASIINLRGTMTAEQVRLERFGSNPQRAADFAANVPVMSFTADSAFWTCIGIGKDAAVESLRTRSGSYWNAVVGAGYTIALAEGGMRKPRRRGSLAAALLTLGLGTGALLVLGD